MSLSTQLTRGALALPMLLGFAGLGLFASERAEAERVLAPVEVVEQMARASEAADIARIAQAAALARLSRFCGAAGRTRVLVLAQAPADLGNLAIRWGHSCRA
jgi:hypothetical protein